MFFVCTIVYIVLSQTTWRKALKPTQIYSNKTKSQISLLFASEKKKNLFTVNSFALLKNTGLDVEDSAGFCVPAFDICKNLFGPSKGRLHIFID